jgi:NAD(P)-dependent dehydrogenase (short-subunit alcohol dehydrogenase family)
MIRMLLVGYCFGIRSERRLCEEVHLNLPSIIDTKANRASMPRADPAKWVAPEELADVILFLASDAASAVTGALLPVNGRV